MRMLLRIAARKLRIRIKSFRVSVGARGEDGLEIVGAVGMWELGIEILPDEFRLAL